MTVRTLVVWCPDWPVRAWGVGPAEPAAVLEASRVTACSAAAREAGVTPGLRRRDAQARCPDLRLLQRDLLREARMFEPVVTTVADFSPLVEVEHPGSCALATRGPSRYFGGDEALAVAVQKAVRAWQVDACVAVADGVFAAEWAARLAARAPAPTPVTVPGRGGRGGLGGRGGRGARSGRGGGASDEHVPAGPGPVVLAPGDSPGFLAQLPLTCLGTGLRPEVRRRRGRVTTTTAGAIRAGRAEATGGDTVADAALVDVLWQLGLRSLGDFAALPEAQVLARFGRDAARRHRLARGVEDQLLDARPPPPDLSAALELDPPAERVDQAAFAAKILADRLHEQLSARGLACARVVVEAETCHGESLQRLWRHEGTLSAAALADRARWQLEGWLAGPAATRPTGGLSRLVLRPDDVVAARGRQLGFWGGETQAAERAARAAARVAGMLGPDAVTVPERRGGRRPDDQFELVPVLAVDLTERGPLPPLDPPWPGRLPRAPVLVAGTSSGSAVAGTASAATGIGCDAAPASSGAVALANSAGTVVGRADRGGGTRGAGAGGVRAGGSVVGGSVCDHRGAPGTGAGAVCDQRGAPGTGLPGVTAVGGHDGAPGARPGGEAVGGQGQVAGTGPVPPGRAVEVLDAEGEVVAVNGRGEASAAPARLDGVEIVAWAGPWPLQERWWDPTKARRQARFQVVTADERAHLLVVEGGRWWSVGRYD
jgi:protein ImuB